MQTSKNHFEAKVVFNDETIRRMFRTEFYTYEGMRHLLWLAAAFVLVMAALFILAFVCSVSSAEYFLPPINFIWLSEISDVGTYDFASYLGSSRTQTTFSFTNISFAFSISA